jgi:hypothetical protein
MGTPFTQYCTIHPEKAVATEITEVSEEKQEDTTNGLIPFG